MVWIKYKQLVGKNNVGTEEEPVLEDVFLELGAEYSEFNLQTVVNELAYNGEYTIEDDGQPEPDTASTDDVLNAMLGVM